MKKTCALAALLLIFATESAKASESPRFILERIENDNLYYGSFAGKNFMIEVNGELGDYAENINVYSGAVQHNQTGRCICSKIMYWERSQRTGEFPFTPLKTIDAIFLDPYEARYSSFYREQGESLLDANKKNGSHGDVRLKEVNSLHQAFQAFDCYYTDRTKILETIDTDDE